MTEKVTILSAAEYFNKYAREGIAKGADKKLIKKQIIDAFHKEIFGLVAMRSKKRFKGKIPEEGNNEAMDIARSVIREETKKYKALIKMFEMFRETSGLLTPDDLTIDVEEEAKDDPDIPEDAVMTDASTMQAVPCEGTEQVTMKVAEPMTSGYIVTDAQSTDESAERITRH